MRSWKDEEHKLKYLINILRHDVRKDIKLDTHTHDFVEIEYVMSGSGVQVINGNEYNVTRGDIIYFDRGDHHTYYTNDNMTIINIIFYYSVYEEISYMLKGYMPNNELAFPTITHLRSSDIFQIEELILKAESEFLKEETGCYLILKSYLSIFLVHLCRSVSSTKINTESKLPIIIEYMDKNFSSISLSDVADRFGYSPNYFSKYFKKNFGVSFIEYVNKKRLNHAIELLTSSDMTVDAICSEVGFKDKKHFYEIFKKTFGTTPAAFRKG